ncbi:MAG: Gx transporter family protein [Clostridiales bacterium]|nr:Gx transporter family protein [Clostridiales bacterium]
MNKSRKMVLMALLISMALVLHYFEHFIPPLAPGAKLGLANIVTMVCLNMFGFGEAMTVVLIRSVLGPMLGGSPTGIMYSLAGGILSCVIMAIMYYRFNKYFSLLGISVAGAVFHNIGQLLVASLLYGTIGILFSYLPIMMLSSVVTGNFIGLAAKYIIRFLDSKAFHVNSS